VPTCKRANVSDKEITIKLTKHAKFKIAQRNIDLNDIKQVVLEPELTKPDKFDSSLIHFIRFIKGKFLRVIGRWEGKKDLLVITAFYDRRLIRRNK